MPSYDWVLLCVNDFALAKKTHSVLADLENGTPAWEAGMVCGLLVFAPIAVSDTHQRSTRLCDSCEGQPLSSPWVACGATNATQCGVTLCQQMSPRVLERKYFNSSEILEIGRGSLFPAQDGLCSKGFV